MFYRLILEGRDSTAPITMKSQCWWRQFLQWNQFFCDSRQNNTYNRDSRNLVILRRCKCLILYCHEIAIFHLPALYPNACRLIFPVLFYLKLAAEMASAAHLGSLENLGSRGPLLVNSDSFHGLFSWSLVPAGVWNRSCVLMFCSTGWGFPAQPDAGSLGNLAKEPPHICQLSCCLVVYICGRLSLMGWVPPARPLFTVRFRWFG